MSFDLGANTSNNARAKATTGTAGRFRVVDGSIGLSGSGADMIIENVVGRTVTISSMTYQTPT